MECRGRPSATAIAPCSVGNAPARAVVYWSDTGDMYTPPGMTVEEMRAIPGTGPEIEGAGGGHRIEGYLGTSGRGKGVGFPGPPWAEYQLPPRTLTRSPGHQRDWIRARTGGEPACSNLGVAGATAARVPGRLLWDGKKMEFTNNREANTLV